MLDKTILRGAAGICIAGLLAGCATTESGGSGAPRTAMDTAIQQCMLTVAGGAILGALIGNNSGHGRGNGGRGAVAGAVAGGAVCAVLLAMANQKDKQQLAAAQRAAATSGKAQTVRYVGDDNKPRLIRVSAPVEVPTQGLPAGYGPCRAVQAHIAITGVGESDAPQQRVCRDMNGDYVAM